MSHNMDTQPFPAWQVYSPSSRITEETETQYTDMLVKHYESSLLANTSALDYLQYQLALDAPDIIASFRLGFSDRSLSASLPALGTFEGEMIRGLYQRFGLFKPNGRETFRGMLVASIFNADNELVGAYGQRIADFPVLKRAESIYIIKPHLDGIFFNHAVLNSFEHLYLCETPSDVMTLAAVGVKNAIGLLDFKYFDDEHLSNLLESGISSVTIAFSRTPKGDRYYSHVRRLLEEVDIKVTKLEGVLGESINSAWVKSKLFDRIKAQLTQSNKHVTTRIHPTCYPSSKH
jgi:DNA primase